MRAVSLLVIACSSLAAGCSDDSSKRNDWAISLRDEFDHAYIYATGDGNTTLVMEMNCDRVFSWPQVGGLNNHGFEAVTCSLNGQTKTFDLRKGLPKPAKQPMVQSSEPPVAHDYGCPAAANRLLKKMGGCRLSTEGITVEALCSKSEKIDSRAVRMVADSKDCEEIKAFLHIE